MKTMTYEELMQRDEGCLALIYGPSGVGKTVSTIQSIPDPFWYVRSEPRETKRIMRAVNRPGIKMKIADHDDFDDLVHWLSDYRNLKGAKSIVIDSISHLMNIRLAGEVQEQAFEARDNSTKARKTLVQQVKLTEEGYGAIGGNMFRLTDVLMQLAARHGMNVICISGEEDRPKWNRSLAGAPVFAGRMYSNNFAGFFDIIGRVSTMVRNDKTVYPPRVDFLSPDESFIAKATGDMKKTVWPLNWKKILKGGE